LFGFAALLFIVYLYLYLLQGQCILKKNISVNMPELAKRQYFICSP